MAGRGRQRSTESEPRPGRPTSAKAVLLVSGRPGATKRYRCDHRAEQLRALGASVDVAMLDEVDLTEILEDYGCFVLHRVPFDGSVGIFLDAAKARGTPVVFDTDDLLFDASAEPFLPEPSRQDDGVTRQRQTLTTCDAATVTTAPLGERAARLQERVLVEPNVVSEEMIRHANAALALKAAGEGPDRMVTIAYLSGTPTHDADFIEAADAVLWALETYPFTRFLGVGRLTVDTRFERFADRVELMEMQPWELLPDVLVAVDVNLAPLERANPFSECKSCLKYLEAGLLGVPTIASPRPDFERVLEHGRNGLLADTPSEWRSALGDLLESPERRHEMGRAAFDDVRHKHTTSAQSIHARETLRSVARPLATAAPLTVNWLVQDAALHPLAENLALRGHVVRHHETDSRPEAIDPADVSIGDRTTARIVGAHERSLFKCVYLSEPSPAPGPGLLAICASSELARDLAESTGRPVEHLDLGETPLPDSTAWAGLAGELEEILRRTCFVSLRHRTEKTLSDAASRRPSSRSIAALP